MKNYFKKNRILMAIALIGLIASLFPVAARVQAEEANKKYDLILDYSSLRAMARQSETASPAAVRTWIQCYNAIREPYNHYGAAELGDEVRALRDAGCTGGFMTWNGASDIGKYAEVISALS